MKLRALMHPALMPNLIALREMDIPAKVSYRIIKARRLIEQELSHFEEARMALCKRLGALNAEGTEYVFEGESKAQADAEYQALLDEEVKTALPTFSPDELGNLNIKPKYLEGVEEVLMTDPA